MTERTEIGQELAGQRVAFTGRLASMSRRSAAELVQRHGGAFAQSVNRQTTALVIGREGWPLRPDGRLTRKLHRARTLQQQGCTLAIAPEEDFLRQVGLEPLESPVCRRYTLAELTDLLELPRARIEAWQRAGLLAPAEVQDGLAFFDFRQVAAVRSLMDLLAAGVQPRRLFRSLRQLQVWSARDESIEELLARLLHEGGRVLYRTDGGHLAETTGQLLIEFDAPGGAQTVSWQGRDVPADLFEEAARMEQEGRLEEAAAGYRRLLFEEGPDADVCFNLANVLHRLGEMQAAIERLHEAVMLDRQHADAWNNLGNLLAEQERLDDAAAAYYEAVKADPDFADARYGLADVLDRLGRLDEARTHWRAYLQQEQTGPWADYARQRLASHTG